MPGLGSVAPYVVAWVGVLLDKPKRGAGRENGIGLSTMTIFHCLSDLL